ncbi:hypothetical protein SH661x_003726 [Planctomicrobium sp. SH661]|uniref:hypothetical protein n=1 Tax=Planctomicrobium sp. SH661 TaxID=3448124 RepID=UPI003F5BCBD0
MATTYLTWSESVSPNRLEVEAIVEGAESYQDAVNAIVEGLPATIGSMQLSNISKMDRIPGNPNSWRVMTVYAINKAKENNGELASGEFEFAFSSSRQTIKRTVAYETRHIFVDPEEGVVETNISSSNLIGYNKKTGQINGVDEPEYLNAFRWKVAVPFSTASESWRRSTGKLRGSLNQNPFFGYEARTVLFEDITGNVKADGLYVLDLSFSQKDHEEDVVIGGIEVGTVEAWDHIDVPKPDLQVETVAGKSRLLPFLNEVKIHRVKVAKDWSLIAGILAMGE